jgi:hypothetical protein
MAALDQGFREFGARLATTQAPYDPSTGRGDPDDTAYYIVTPGSNFMRPWLAIRGGAAFQWPLGMEGFSLTVDPALGTHRYIGDNKVVIDVLHAGEEHFSMSGTFPGLSAPALVGALKDLVYKQAGPEGKILWLPEVVTYAQRVQVVRFTADRGDQDRGKDMRYTIEFVRLGITQQKLDPDPKPSRPQPTASPKGSPARSVKVDAKHNSLRKIAAWKLGSSTKWRQVYEKNENWFVKNSVSIAKAPDYRLALGMKVYY